MKKILILLLLTISVFSLNACKKKKEVPDLIFTQREYQLISGQSVSVIDAIDGISYEIVNNEYSSVKIDSKTGVITFDTSIPNYSQVLVIAKYQGKQSQPCTVTLYYDWEESDVNFTNLSPYIVNNEYINAVSSLNYAVTYSLKEEVKGIAINKNSGKVSYSPIVKDGTNYTIVADSHGSKIEMTFIAMTKGFVNAIVDRQVLSKTEQTIPAVYSLDFSESEISEEDGIVAVLNSKNEQLDQKYYSYNVAKNQVEIAPSYVDELPYGETTLKIITKRNTVYVELDVVTKFIYTPEDLASIDDSKEALSGYYILMTDIDLTEYLSPEGAGYNDGKGWTPIGSYVDEALDLNIATEYAFKGTFDGNGHTISGLYANRKDAASFNAGLFGYTTNKSIIKNLGVEGKLYVSSYSGGLVGVNSGLIENCWSNVDIDVYSGEDVYRYVGGFVGNNNGIIENCYSLGEVKSDYDFARFAGNNEGIINNCYSYSDTNSNVLVGAGFQAENYLVFENEEEMNVYNWENVFSNKYWNFVENNVPTLKELIVDSNVRCISINIDKKTIYTQDIVELDCLIYPNTLYEEFIDEISYEVISEGAYIVGDKVYIENNATELQLKATLIINGITYTDTIELDVVKKIEQITLNKEFSEVEVGNSYTLNATVTPFDAEEKIFYKLNANYYGVSIDGNILTIDPEYNLTSSIMIYAVTETGLQSDALVLNVKKHTPLSNSPIVIYQNEQKDLEFKFDKSLNLNNIKVTLFNKEVNYEINDNFITVSKDVVKDYVDMKCRFIFTLSNGNIYAQDVYNISHKNYQYLSNIDEEEVIYINSVEDFYKHFNADPNRVWDEAKLANYDKVFILTTDLDFGGKTLYGIGTENVKFSGKFYGMGHTIKNFNIYHNEYSSNYCVGLFANVNNAEFYDIVIENAKVSGNNFVGGLVGMITSGKIENCIGINCDITANEYQYSADDIHVGKLVGMNHNTKIICLYYEGLSINTLG